MSSNQALKPHQICRVKYGSHIGEYIRYKLDLLGISQAFVAKRITEDGREMTRSNLSRILTNRAEFTPSEMLQFTKALPEGFFDEFYETNPKLRPYQPTKEEEVNHLKEEPPAYQVKGSGYRISIEIDPVDFNPSYMDPLSESLKKALEEFHDFIKEDKKRTK